MWGTFCPYFALLFHRVVPVCSNTILETISTSLLLLGDFTTAASVLTSHLHCSDNLYGAMASAHSTFKLRTKTLTRTLTLGVWGVWIERAILVLELYMLYRVCYGYDASGWTLAESMSIENKLMLIDIAPVTR